jgi:hypothetical protein
VDGGDRVGLQHLGDQLMEGRDLGELGVLQLGGDQLREPLTDKLGPPGRTDRLLAGLDAGLRRSDRRSGRAGVVNAVNSGLMN